MTTFTHFECSRCGRRFDPSPPPPQCGCGGWLLVRYDLEGVRQGWSREWLNHAPPDMWRYAPLLPASGFGSAVSLGEGMSPLIRMSRLDEAAGPGGLWLKDDGVNPAGSAEARAASCLFTMARQLGLTGWHAAADGMTGAALALYGSAAGIPIRLTPAPGTSLTAWLAASAAGALAAPAEEAETEAKQAGLGVAAWSYRVEGMKTIGLEIAEQLRWIPPSAVLCPAGDGAGLVGVWKAFEELRGIGWVTGKTPRLFAVQAQECRPIVDAIERGLERCEACRGTRRTIATSILAKLPPADDLILRVIRESGGGAAAVRDQEMLDSCVRIGQKEGVFASPEGGACLAALRRLRSAGVLGPEDTVVLINPASGLLYPEAYTARFPRLAMTEQDKLGGLITPR